MACGQEKTRESESSSSSPALVGVPGLQNVESGELEVLLNVAGSREHDLYMRVLGTFLGVGSETLPQVDFGAEVSGELRDNPVDISTALISTDDRAVLTYEGDTFETTPHMFDALRRSFGDALGSGSAADLAACLEVAGQIPLSQLAGGPAHPVRTTRLKGSTESTISAELKVQGMIEALHQFEQDPGCGAQLRVADSLRNALSAVEKELEREADAAEARLTLDENGTWRELWVHMGLGPQGQDAPEAEFVLRLNKVNEIAKLPPCRGERPLAALFRKLGFNPLESIESGDAEGVLGLLEGIYGQSAEARRA